MLDQKWEKKKIEWEKYRREREKPDYGPTIVLGPGIFSAM